MKEAPASTRALVTGASSGIGREIALAFASAGVEVAVVGRSQAKLEALVAAAGQQGTRAKAYHLDLAAVTDIRAAVADIVADFGGIDILVNSAGMGYTNPIAETSLADWQQVFALNLTSVLQCIQGVLPTLRAQGGGTIVNVASIAAANPFPGWGAYSASKAALVSLTKTLAAEERDRGIRAIVVSPGAVNTPLWDTEAVRVELDRAAMLDPQVVATAIVQAALLPANATIEELTITPSAGAL
ncbi:MAG: SDR family oxidoreductase [Cyanobacteria bacterium J06641_5]